MLKSMAVEPGEHPGGRDRCMNPHAGTYSDISFVFQ